MDLGSKGGSRVIIVIQDIQLIISLHYKLTSQNKHNIGAKGEGPRPPLDPRSTNICWQLDYGGSRPYYYLGFRPSLASGPVPVLIAFYPPFVSCQVSLAPNCAHWIVKMRRQSCCLPWVLDCVESVMSINHSSVIHLIEVSLLLFKVIRLILNSFFSF